MVLLNHARPLTGNDVPFTSKSAVSTTAGVLATLHLS